MAGVIIPFIVLFVILYGFLKKVDLYDNFLVGVKEGLSMALKIFPTIFAMTVCINIMLKSNIINDVVNFISPVLDFLKFPRELVTLSIMRPISGNSSLIIMDNLLKTYGPDSFIGRTASIIQGSSDTTIYIIGLYFFFFFIKKIKYSLVVGLLADLMAVIISVIVILIIYFVTK